MSIKDNKKLMKPLWLAYPTNDRYDIGWRMGRGEDYAWKFCDWFDELTEDERRE